VGLSNDGFDWLCLRWDEDSSIVRCLVGPAQLTSIQINKDISAKHGAGGVLTICEARLAEFDRLNAVSALHRIAKAPDGPEVT